MISKEPEKVFRFFEEICGIPHGSYNTERISNYLAEFASDRELEFIQDKLGNVIIYKAASEGYESHPTVIIQGHMDMVAVKEADCHKNLDEEGLDLAWDDEYLWAEGTSLGGDDGIAVAMALAILDDDNLKHPPIEAVFTVNEEVGMDGALGLDMSLLKGRMMLNVDSEEEGILTVGCAGGQRVEVRLPLAKETTNGTSIGIKISGLLGGHSGTMINTQRANANVLMVRLLMALSDQFDMRIASINGGEKCNAICHQSNCDIVIKNYEKVIFDELVSRVWDVFKSEYADIDPGIVIISSVSAEGQFTTFDEVTTKKCVGILMTEPNGVIDYNSSIPGLVETSLNVGVIGTEDEVFYAKYELRSSVGSKIKFLADRVALIGKSFGANVVLADAYPEWEYNRNSKLIGLMTGIYEQQYGQKMKIEIIHAGLECGVFSKRLDGLDAVSFGPNILDIHTTGEKLDIKSTERVYKYILRVLEEI